MSQLNTKRRKFVEIFYDPDRFNWHAEIERKLKRRGLQRGQVTVICRPYGSSMKKTNVIHKTNYQ